MPDRSLSVLALPIHRALRRRSTGVLVPVTAAAAVLAVLAASRLDLIGPASPPLCRRVGPVRAAGADLAWGGMMADSIVLSAPAASASLPVYTITIDIRDHAIVQPADVCRRSVGRP